VIRTEARAISTALPRDDHAASIAAYAVRLADLIGEDLGVGAIAALEVELGSNRVFVHRDGAGNTIGATSTSDAESSALRERLGL